jgi:pimeloyl-ACP methyl ester carboxylesterase
VTRVRRGYDWGDRSERWAGVTSDVVQVGGTRVHFLRTAAANSLGPGTPITHVLVHPMGAGSWSWMDVIRPLSAFGAVIAPDLPGSGRTRPGDRAAGDAESGARFLIEFTRTLGLERVVVHGHSMGGLIGALAAGLAPERVARLVLTSPPLPGRPDPPRFPRLWRAAFTIAPPLARIMVGAGIRAKAEAWRRWRRNPDDPRLAAAFSRLGTDATRISPELLALIAEEIERYRLGWRIDGAVAAAISVLAALTVDEARIRLVLNRIRAPTLLLWGTNDRVIPRALVDQLVEVHPGWEFRALEGIGHGAPWEAPATYVDLVGPWTVEAPGGDAWPPEATEAEDRAGSRG